MQNPPPLPLPQPRRSRITWWWFLIPLLTLGLGSFPLVLLGGTTLRSRAHTLAAFGYLALTIGFCVGVLFTTPDHIGVADAVALPTLLVSWLGGTGHVAVLQTRVRALNPAARPAVPDPAAGPAMPDPAVAAAQWRLNRRQEARALLAGNPPLAVELRIGRPDLPRQYDDGGLLDLNHVPAGVLARELGLPAALAEAIMAERDRRGGFNSPDELVVYCDQVTPEWLDLVRDRLLFLPV